MRKILFFGGVGVLALAVRNLLHFYFPLFGTAPDLVLILVVYLGVFRSPLRGMLLAFALGYLSDLAGGGFVGLTSLSYLLLFLLARLVGRVFYARNAAVQVMMVGIGSVLCLVTSHLVLHGFDVLPGLLPGRPLRLLAQSLYTAALAPLLFRLLFRIEAAVTDPDRERHFGGRGASRDGWAS